MSKLIYSPTSSQLEQTYQHVKESDQLTNGAYFSVAFTGDGYLYTHGKKFRLFKIIDDEVSGIQFTISNGTAQLTIDGASIGSGTVVQSVSGDTIVDATTTNGAVALTHKQYLNLNNATLYGGNLKVPIITVDKYGHITAVSEGTNIDVTKVKADTTTNTGTWYLTGVSGNTLQNPIYNTDIYFDKNGTLYAKDITINNNAISNIFAPASHTSVGATDLVLGHVKLSDDYAQNPAANTAASPKAVYKALVDSKAYADELVQAQDSMIFVGTINHQGIIKAHNDKVLTATDDTTNISEIPYKVGWTFRFTSAGTFLGQVVEIGDIIIAVKDKASAFAVSDWTIIQTNIDGSLTSSANLNGVLYANNSRSISALAFSSGVLTSNGSTISFVDANTLWRTIKVDGTSIGTNALDLKHGTYTTLTNTNGEVVIEAKAADIIGTTQKLTIKKSTTSFEYKPNAAATLNIGDKLSLTESNGAYTLSHASGTTITSKLGKITTDSYGHITSVEEITTLPNAYKFIVKDASSNLIEYDGSVSNKVLKIVNGTDISLTLSTSNGEVVLTPSIAHKYRPVQYYATSSAENATNVLANSVNTTLTLVGGTNVTLSSGSTTGSIVISAEDTWRDVQAYKFASNILSRSSIAGALKFNSDFLFEDNEVGLCWTEIDDEGRVTYVK